MVCSYARGQGQSQAAVNEVRQSEADTNSRRLDRGQARVQIEWYGGRTAVDGRVSSDGLVLDAQLLRARRALNLNLGALLFPTRLPEPSPRFN